MSEADDTLRAEILIELERFEQETQIVLYELCRVQGEHRARLLALLRRDRDGR